MSVSNILLRLPVPANAAAPASISVVAKVVIEDVDVWRSVVGAVVVVVSVVVISVSAVVGSSVLLSILFVVMESAIVCVLDVTCSVVLGLVIGASVLVSNAAALVVVSCRVVTSFGAGVVSSVV